MNELAGLIGEIIELKGHISLAGYMRLCLQHPDWGYYRRGNPLGRGGDFITSPEISQMFGEMIGLWCADVWRQMGSPDPFVLLELGPGGGTLMGDALRATGKLGGFQKALRLHLLESSETLQGAQRERLATYQPVFIDDIADLPPLPVLVIANEFFDALPIRQFEKSFIGWQERVVVKAEGGSFAYALRPLDETAKRLIPDTLAEAKLGAVYEISLESLVLMRKLARQLASYRGAGLIIDYGAAEPALAGTFQAVSGHGIADTLSRPGEIDLTAHVDFGALRNVIAAEPALRSEGLLGQGEFLGNLGIGLRARQLKHAATPEQGNAIDAALQRLTEASQMGTLFKTLALASKDIGTLPGF